MRLRTMQLPLANGDADTRFVLIIDRLDMTEADREDFAHQIAIFRDQVGAAAVLVSEHDIELDSDPVLISDLPVEASPVIARMRELRDRLARPRPPSEPH